MSQFVQRACFRLIVAMTFTTITTTLCAAQTVNFVAPPRTTTDIAATLEQEKPDSGRLAKLQSEAKTLPPQGANQKALARFYFLRAEARGTIGRVAEAIADAKIAIDYSRIEGLDAMLLRSEQLLGSLLGWSGDTKDSLQVFREVERQESQGTSKFNSLRWVGINLIALGDLNQAQAVMKKNEARLAEAQKKPGWASTPTAALAEAHISFGNAAVEEAEGKFGEAAESYRKAEALYSEGLARLNELASPPIRSNIEQAIYWMAARLARVEARNGQLAQSEFDVRRALLGWLKIAGKYNLNTARIINEFARILVEQARYKEAEQLTRTVIDIYQTLGAERDSQVYAICLNELAGILALEGRWNEATDTYNLLDQSTSMWEQTRKDEIGLDFTRIQATYRVNELTTGIAAAERLVARQTERFGRTHPETALAKGLLAVGLFRAGRVDDALSLFQSAAPILILGADNPQSDDDDAVGAAAREQRIQTVIESYMALLARGSETAADSLQLAEAIRGRSVQKALAASSTRAVAREPALADLARREQDLHKQIGAKLGILNNVLAGPSAGRDPAVVDALRGQIETLRAAHEAADRSLIQQFPDYAELMDPKPPTVDEIRTALQPDEAFLSFYFGRDISFVWAVPKQGAIRFVQLPVAASEIEAKVRKVREALEPNAATIGDIPAFDLALAYDLYRLLLKPVEAGWKSAKSLVIVTNGALGLLPLSLLPTAPVEVRDNEEPMFAGYRHVPWLARTHAVTMVPSAAALLTLRRLQPASPSREKLVAFGDPYFNDQQAADAADENSASTSNVQVADALTTRGLPLRRRSIPDVEGLNSAELGLLPRLPDTADELRSIALALETDPSKVLHLGKNANEREVKTIELSKFKIVVFATHGLLPGDLNGLTQPALALTAPSVAGIDGDGLLTMDEILSLKLDADWVVLSACNSGAGATAGAEAASGLGRAFFYAGSRAILVTNWSVHSISARELVSDMFRRQAAGPGIARAEALRQAMVSMIDGGGYKDDAGRTLFDYAHPLFWAPYTIIGDGGASK
jgi:CHAT domain-containing protein